MKTPLNGELVAAGIACIDKQKLDRLLKILEANPHDRVERTKEFLLREVGMETLLEYRALLFGIAKAKGAQS